MVSTEYLRLQIYFTSNPATLQVIVTQATYTYILADMRRPVGSRTGTTVVAYKAISAIDSVEGDLVLDYAQVAAIHATPSRAPR